MGASRNVRLGFVIGSALVLVLASSFAALGAAKKPFTADVSPHTVSTGSTATYTVTVTNKALTQQLGSCNLTAPAGFTLGAITSPPSPGSATIVGNTVQLRNLSTIAMTSRSASFTASAPGTPGLYTWAIICRQANNFNPDKPSNEFGLDAAGSNMKTNVVSPLPVTDMAVTGNAESQDPVTAANTVIYTVTVHNFGPEDSGPLTLTDSMPNGGTITAASGTNWTCVIAGGGGSASCTHDPIANLADAETVTVNVLTPDADTVITNRASISQTGRTDPNSGNNTLDQTTQVNQNTTCPEGQVSCGSGTIDHSQDSQVQSCQAPTMLVFLCGKVTFAATTSSGTQVYGIYAFKTPENVCPVSVNNSGTLVRCDWELFMDDVPVQQTVGGTVVVITCHQSKCPAGLGDAGTIIVYIGANGQRQLLQKCSGPSDTNKCWERTRIDGNLVITIRNIPPGDPKIAGRCLAGC